MLCDKCKKNNASYFSRTTINGVTHEEHLCLDCAKKLKCPLGTVKSRLYNAKKELAEKLKNLM